MRVGVRAEDIKRRFTGSVFESELGYVSSLRQTHTCQANMPTVLRYTWQIRWRMPVRKKPKSLRHTWPMLGLIPMHTVVRSCATVDGKCLNFRGLGEQGMHESNESRSPTIDSPKKSLLDHHIGIPIRCSTNTQLPEL